jgi:hypothetical protein
MKDWLGNVVLSISGGIVILGLLVLNAYWQRLVRKEDEQLRVRLASEHSNLERSAASQSRRPEGSSETAPKGDKRI